jgi:hypothetical protein
MSDTRIEEIEKRLAEATPGPWEYQVSQEFQSKHFWIGPGRTVICETVDCGTRADAILITNAPADIRFLLDEVKRLTWPTSDASKQHHRRVFDSIEECQDFYCGYIQQQIKTADQLRAQLEKFKAKLGSAYNEFDDARLVRDQLKARVEELEALIGRIANTITNPISMTDAKMQLSNIERACLEALSGKGGGE